MLRYPSYGAESEELGVARTMFDEAPLAQHRATIQLVHSLVLAERMRSGCRGEGEGGGEGGIPSLTMDRVSASSIGVASSSS
jgi:hypothetical protein